MLVFFPKRLAQDNILLRKPQVLLFHALQHKNAGWKHKKFRPEHSSRLIFLSVAHLTLQHASFCRKKSWVKLVYYMLESFYKPHGARFSEVKNGQFRTYGTTIFASKKETAQFHLLQSPNVSQLLDETKMVRTDLRTYAQLLWMKKHSRWEN